MLTERPARRFPTAWYVTVGLAMLMAAVGMYLIADQSTRTPDGLGVEEVGTSLPIEGSGPDQAPVAPDDEDPTSASAAENPFIPEDRNLSDCISAIPKPGCGSEAKGGIHQGLVLVALLGGLGLIGWRVVAGMRKQRP